MKKILCCLFVLVCFLTACKSETPESSSGGVADNESSSSEVSSSGLASPSAQIKITYHDYDFGPDGEEPECFSFDVSDATILKQLNEYREVGDFNPPPEDIIVQGMCSYWVTYPDGYVIGILGLEDYGTTSTEIKFQDDEVIVLPTGMSDLVGELVEPRRAKKPIRRLSSPSVQVKITYSNDDYAAKGEGPEFLSFDVSDATILKQLDEYRQSDDLRYVRKDEAVCGMCSYWITFPDDYVIGVYDDLDYGNIDNEIEYVGQEVILPTGMSAFVGGLVKSHMGSSSIIDDYCGTEAANPT